MGAAIPMTTPFPPDSEPDGKPDCEPDAASDSRPAFPGALSPALVETLVRFDEADDDAIAKLDDEPLTRHVLLKLRAADAYLQSGRLSDHKTLSPTVPAESLFAFGRGELDEPEADVVRKHLRQAPEENAWVETLRGSPPPATLTWDAIESPDEILAGPGSKTRARTGSVPGWVVWTPLAAAALVLAMAIGGGDRRNVLDGGLPTSPILRSAGTEALLFPRGRVIASTAAAATYASEPLFEVTPVKGASQYGFELRDVTNQDAFGEGEVVWEGTSKTHHATASPLRAGHYVWRATAMVNGIDRDLGSLSFTVVPVTAVDRALFVRAAKSQRDTIPAVLREDIRRLHASGFLTDARGRARALPPGDDRDRYLATRGDL